MKKKLEALGIIFVFLGLTISFCELNGCFPNPKLDLANRIINLGENVLPFDTPYVDELILTFLADKYPKLKKENLSIFLRDCEGIGIENLILDGHDTIGSVRIRAKDGVRAEVICGFQDLQNWAKSSQYVRWIGWAVALVGAILQIIQFFIKEPQ